MHDFSFSIRTEWGGFILGCGFYAHTNSLSVRANVRFRVRLVDAGTALRPLLNTVIFSLLPFFAKSPNSVESKFLFEIQCNLRYNDFPGYKRMQFFHLVVLQDRECRKLPLWVQN